MRLAHGLIVGIQILAGAVVVLGGAIDWHSWRFPIGLIFVLGFIALMAWSLIIMRASKLRFEPEVHKNAKLIRKGPYRYIRHPMYTSVLLLGLGFLIAGFNLVRLIAMIVLIVDLAIKIPIEEQSLRNQFEEYAQYASEVKRLLPWIY